MVATTEHGSLTANVVKSVTVDADSSGFEVVNRDMTGEIWVRLDGQNPVPRAAGTYVVLGARRFPGGQKYGPVTCKLIAEVDRQFSVEGAAG